MDVATGSGVSAVAFVMAAYARRVGGGRGSPLLNTELALAALAPVVYARLSGSAQDWIHPKSLFTIF